MKRLITNMLCFAVTLATGVCVSLFWTFLRSEEGDIRAIAVLDEAPSVTPIVIPNSSPIREIDFANFTYPSQFVGETRGFKVRNGERLPKRKDKIGRPLDWWLILEGVTYGDVTGDGHEEAIVKLHLVTGGSALPDFVYIYGLRKGKLRLLWVFETGDRADGGCKNVFAEHGELIVELYGKNKIIGRDLYEDDGTNTGDCCPTYFTRTTYAWSRNRFRQKGTSEVLPLEGNL
jgi:hypothetical protein